MRRIFVSEMDERAPELAQRHGLGLELIGFCDAARLEDEAFLRQQGAKLADLPDASLHAPFYEIFPGAIDPLMREAAMKRLRQAAAVCERLGISRMVVHSGDVPAIYYPEWFVPRSIEFWREFMAELPMGMEVRIENVLDLRPETLATICDGIGDPRAKLCLDTGHAHVNSPVPVEAWIEALGSRIGHVHLHNNSGQWDEHAPLDRGDLDIKRILRSLDEHAPEAVVCIESMDAPACLRFLSEGGFLK